MRHDSLPPLRVLLLNQFYPPDVAPTGRYLHNLARELVARGHGVDVLCSRARYDDGTPLPPAEVDGARVERVAGLGAGRGGLLRRGAGFAWFLAAAARRARGLPRPDVVLALTTPPYVGLLARRIATRRGVAHAHWVMDVYPDVLAAHGLVRRDGLAWRGLAALARRSLRGSALVVALGSGMRRALADYAPGDTLRTLPLWAPFEPGPAPRAEAARAAAGWAAEELVLLYSGNLGRSHLLDEFLEAARQLGPTGPRWVFSGGGPQRAVVEGFRARHPAARVEIRPYVDEAELREWLAAADVHLASLAPAFVGAVVPSKLQAAFALGRPLLFVGPGDSEAGQWLRESQGGWQVEPGDVEGLLRAVAQAGERAERERRGAAALEFARRCFDPRQGVARLADWLEQAAAR